MFYFVEVCRTRVVFLLSFLSFFCETKGLGGFKISKTCSSDSKSAGFEKQKCF